MISDKNNINGIIAVLDNEDEARLIFRHSVVLAKNLKKPLVLFKTISVSQIISQGQMSVSGGFLEPSLLSPDIHRTKEEQMLAKMQKEAIDHHGVSCQYALRNGFETTELLNLLDEYPNFLPVMSIGNQHSIADVWLGSKAHLVASNIPKSIYFVPPKGPFTIPRYFLYIFNENELKSDTSTLEELVAGLDASVKFAQFSSEYDLSKKSENLLDTYKVDCIAVHSHNQGFVERLFEPEAALKMLIKTDLPMLLMHQPSH